MAYRTKPIEVDAYQVARELLESVLFNGKPYPNGLRMTSGSYNPTHRTINAWFGRVVNIDNEEIKVVEGDWIITEDNGVNHYVCKPDVFYETYESVPEV